MEFKYNPKDEMDDEEYKLYMFYIHLIDAITLDICKDESSSIRFLVRNALVQAFVSTPSDYNYEDSLALCFFQSSIDNLDKALSKYTLEPFAVSVQRRPDGTPTYNVISITF